MRGAVAHHRRYCRRRAGERDREGCAFFFFRGALRLFCGCFFVNYWGGWLSAFLLPVLSFFRSLMGVLGLFSSSVFAAAVVWRCRLLLRRYQAVNKSTINTARGIKLYCSSK